MTGRLRVEHERPGGGEVAIVGVLRRDPDAGVEQQHRQRDSRSSRISCSRVAAERARVGRADLRAAGCRPSPLRAQLALRQAAAGNRCGSRRLRLAGASRRSSRSSGNGDHHLGHGVSIYGIAGGRELAWADPDRGTRRACDARKCKSFVPALGRNGEFDLLDLAERHLQEPGAELAERGDVAGAEEAVGALPVALAVEPRPPRVRWAAAATAWPPLTRRTSRPRIRCSIGATSG